MNLSMDGKRVQVVCLDVLRLLASRIDARNIITTTIIITTTEIMTTEATSVIYTLGHLHILVIVLVHVHVHGDVGGNRGQSQAFVNSIKARADWHKGDTQSSIVWDCGRWPSGRRL